MFVASAVCFVWDTKSYFPSIFDTIMDETRTTSRPKLIFPSLLIRIFRKKGVAIPQDISSMSTPSAINKQTFKRISVCLMGLIHYGYG